MTRVKRKTASEPSSKDKILNAAEALFSQSGFDGVSLRQIAQAADVDLGLIPHYFETKDNLYRQTLQRRADALNFERLRRLDEARIQAAGASPSVEKIIEAYLMPVVEKNLKAGERWRNYTRLVAQASYSPTHDKILSELMDPTASHFISALRMALPQAATVDIYWGFHYLKSAVVMTLAGTSRIDLLSRGLCNASDIEEAFRKMVPFIAAGFERLASSGADSREASATKRERRPGARAKARA